MKKGRRQIVQKNIFQSGQNSMNQQQSSQQESQSNYMSQFQNKAINIPVRKIQNFEQKQHANISHITNQTKITQQTQYTKQSLKINKSNVEDKISISPNSIIKNQNQPMIPTISSQNKQKNIIKVQNKPNQDDKKSKIQLLKQKYLKKNTQNKIVTEEKPNPVIIQQQKINEKSTVTSFSQSTKNTNNVTAPIKTDIRQNILIDKSKQAQKQRININNNKIQIKSNTSNLTKIIERDQKLVNKKSIETHLQQKIQIKNKQQPLQEQQLQNVHKNQNIQPYVPPPNNTKKATKSKVPPPPPPKPVKKQVYAQEVNQINQQAEQNIQIPQPQQPMKTNLQELQTEKPITRSFVPPPPPIQVKSSNKSSNLVNQILAKKLKKAQVIQPNQQQAIQDFSINNFNNPKQQQVNINIIQTKNLSSKLTKNNNINKDNILDDQYKQKQIIEQKQQINISSLQIDLKSLITKWINTPLENIQIFLPHAGKLMNIDPQSAPQKYFQSKNSSYSNVLNNFLVNFVFNSKTQLSQQQKISLHQFALCYYYSDPKYLTPEFLLILLKLGQTFMLKYIQFFKQNNIHSYYLTILQYKHYLLKQQLQNFISLILDNRKLTNNQFFYLILIFPSQKLISTIVIAQNNTNDIILLLSIIKIKVKENNNLIGVYLRYLNALIDNIQYDSGQFQIILKYIQELKVEKHYQTVKDIKLKLLNRINNAQPVKKQEEEPKQSGGGFLGYFNKAVDKLKTATTQLTEVINQKDKNKNIPVKQQEKEPQDDIVYDPVLKRYLINGKLPDNQQTQKEQTQIKPPSRPPPKGQNSNKPITPPPPPGKKTRVINNRYAS